MGPMTDDELRRLARMPWLTVAECAVYLSKSEDAIRCLIKRGIIPPKRLGRTIYVDRLALDDQIRNSGHGRHRRRAKLQQSCNQNEPVEQV